MGRKHTVTKDEILPLIKEGRSYGEIARILGKNKSSVYRAVKRLEPSDYLDYSQQEFDANETQISSRLRMKLMKLIEHGITQLDDERFTVEQLKKLVLIHEKLKTSERLEEGQPTQLIGVGHRVDPKQLEELKQAAQEIAGQVVQNSVPQIEYDAEGMIIDVED